MSTAWAKSTDSVELSRVEQGDEEQEQTNKPQNWIQQGLARINTKKRIKSYGTCSESMEDDSKLFLHQDSEDIPDYQKKRYDFVQVFDKLGSSIYFADGIRKIDYVLVFNENLEDARKRKQPYPSNKIATASLAKQTSQDTMELSKKEQWRNKFLENIQKDGLQIEEEIIEQGKKAFVFLKIHATWPVLCHYAEELSMRAPLMLKTEPSDLRNGSETFLAYFGSPNPMKLKTPHEPLHFYTCPFRENKLRRFIGSDNKEKYFTTIQRIRIVNEVLSRAVFGKQRKGEVGIDRLVHEGVFAAAYPLHDGPYKAEMENGVIKNVEDLNPRQILYEYWARWGRWYKYQPLDHIRNYFGEKVGMYFAWLGFYTSWLFPAAIVGILVFLYGLITVFDNPYSNDVCEKPGKYKMCPQHELGKFWDLYDICTYIRISYLFDHPGSVFYSIFISFWAVSFLEYWKRKCATIAYQWDCTDFQGEEERPRAEYAAKAPFIAVNPVTGIKEPMFPEGKRGKRIATGLGLVFVMISVVIIFIFAIIVFRIAIAIPLHNMNMTRGYAHTMANITGAGLNFVIIMIMSKFYEWLAQKLTRWEMHRTQSEFDDNYTFKVFVFQFVNFYSSIFYIAFFKGRFVGYPGNYVYIFNMRNEECEEGGCLIELAQQLAIIMIGKQVINNFMEIGIPWVKAWWIKTKARHKKCKDSNRMNQIQEDYYTSPNEGLFQEYLEMVLQFGFITLFVAAFPLAPLFALLNNWVEIRLDAQKFVCHTRRNVPERTEDIGMWFRILQYLAHIAVITNGLLIAFTSRFLMKLLYQYEYNWSEEGYYDFILSWAPNGTYNERCRYRGQRDEYGNYTMFFWKLLAIQFAFVLAFEYFVFTICRLIDMFVADVPPNVDIKIRRERYLAKQALLDNDLFKTDKEETENSRNVETIIDLSEPTPEKSRSKKQTLMNVRTNPILEEDETTQEEPVVRTRKVKGRRGKNPKPSAKFYDYGPRPAKVKYSQSAYGFQFPEDADPNFEKKSYSINNFPQVAEQSEKQKFVTFKPISVPVQHRACQTDQTFIDVPKIAQRRQRPQSTVVDKRKNLENAKKRKSFPFTTFDESRGYDMAPVLVKEEEEEEEDSSSSSSTSSDVFLPIPHNRLFSTFTLENPQGRILYTNQTDSHPLRSGSPSIHSSWDSISQSESEKSSEWRRKSLDITERRIRLTDYHRPRPRSWLGPTKYIPKES